MARTKAQRFVVETGLRQGRILRGLSARTQMMRRKAIEGLDFDFKRTIKSLEQDDVVAFASSLGGGIVICGIEDGTAEIIGCGNSTAKSIDANKLAILNKAAECDPPIPVVVDVENVARNKPIYVIHIPQVNELCCTRSGRYLTRQDGRNVRISPTQMKARVLELEAVEFTRRLESAAKHLETQITDLDDRVFDLNTTVEGYEAALNDIASDISETSASVEIFSDAMAADIVARIEEAWRDLSQEHYSIDRHTRLVEKLANALLLAVGDKGEDSVEELLERADTEVVRRHSISSPESGGTGIRMLFERAAKEIEEDTGRTGSGVEFIKRCLVGTLLLGRCPHCGARDYPFLIDAEEIDFKVISASPMELEINCPRCGETIEHAEESITSSGW